MQVRRSILILIIVAACLGSYFNTIFADFVWDDNTFFVSKPYTRYFRSLPEFFLKDFWSVYDPSASCHYYRPFLAAAFMLNYALWREKPLGYHLTNIILHILVCILIFKFVELLIKNRIIAFIASLLFGVHSIHTEAVSFITNISYVMSAVFFMLSLVLLLKYSQYKRLIIYLFSLVCFSLSLLTIEVAIILPLIVICIDYIFLSQCSIKKVIKNFWRIHLGFFIVLGIYLITRSYVIGWSFIARRAFIETNFSSGTHPFWRFFTVIKIIALYIRLLFFPYDLKVEYFFSPSNSLFEPVVLIGIALLFLFVFIAFRNIKRYPILSFSILWFFITVLPVSNIFPQGNIFAERYMYIPSVGFCISIGFLFWWLLNKDIKTTYLNWMKSIYIVFFLLIIALGRVTYERNKVWENDLVLWQDTTQKSPENFRAHLNLGAAYYNSNLFDKALEEVNIALQLKPLSSEALFILGSIYLKKGFTDEAINEFKGLIQIFPRHARTYVSLSAAYYIKGEYEKAIDAAIKALKNNPNLYTARYNLAISYAKVGLIDEAVNAYKEYLKTNPNCPDVHIDVGYLYYNRGNFQKAKEHWLLALKVSKDYLPAQKALKLLEK